MPEQWDPDAAPHREQWQKIKHKVTKKPVEKKPPEGQPGKSK